MRLLLLPLSNVAETPPADVSLTPLLLLPTPTHLPASPVTAAAAVAARLRSA
jgi:hypothetical protein